MAPTDAALAKLCIEAHLDLLEARRVRKFMVDFMLTTQELMVEFAKTGDWQRHERALAELVQREGLRMNVPPWFWRVNPAEPIESQIAERARWLFEEGFSLDDAWDLLSDVMRGMAAENGTQLSARKTKQLLESALEEKYGCTAQSQDAVGGKA